MYSNLRPEDSSNELSPEKLHRGSSSFVDDSKIPSQLNTPDKNITKRSMFGNDQEIFVDSDTPLILISDMNLHNPISTKFKNGRLSFSSNKSKFMGSNARKIFPDLGASSSTTKDKNQAISTISDNDINKSLHEQDHLNQSSERFPSRIFPGGNGKIHTPMESPTMLLSKQSLNESMENEVDVFDNGEKKETNRFKLRLRTILDSVEYNLFIAVFVFYTLFDNEANTLWFNVHANIVFDVFNIIAIITFALDVMMNLLVTKGYQGSFYFWLDAVSTITIVLDINMISENYFLSGKGIYARASRGSDIGTKMSRVVRIIRLVRVLKLYKQFKKNQEMREMRKVRMASVQRVHPIMNKTLMRANTMQPGMMTPQSNRPTSHQSIRSNPGRAIGGRGSILGRSNLSMAINSSDATQDMSSLRQTKDSGFSQSQSERAVLGLSRKSIFSQFHFLKGGLQKVDTRKRNEHINKLANLDSNIKESRVGKKLSDLSIRRTVLMVLALMLFIPMFSGDFYFNVNAAFDYETNFMQTFLNDKKVSDKAVRAYLESFKEQQTSNLPPMFLFEVGDEVFENDPKTNIDNLRNSEFILVKFDTLNGTLTAANNARPRLIIDSYLSVGRTIFIIMALAFIGFLLSKDTDSLILGPIGRMIKKVNSIAHNPLMAKEQSVRETNPNFKNETIEIENAIIKIGSLLALGYGDAGAAIIAKNVAQSIDLDPMLHGRKKMAIFGFCDIRNFTDATEVLQEDVMVFVNSIAEIVHSIVDAHTGAANKNIGDAFLLVWKFPDDQVIEGSEGELKKTNIVVNMADLALMSFFKIYARINRDPTLLEYRSNPRLNSRLPNYKVKMGFGMHIGWAIEGAIGSEFKIDASYLSPNVNMAARLEAATKQYGVPLLYSGELYDRLSKDMKKKSRLIDIVTVKGSIKPIYLYTADMDVEEFELSDNRAEISLAEKRSQQKERKAFYQNLAKSEGVGDLIQEDYELSHMFRNHSIEFEARFKAGFNSYIGGDWSDAKRKFESCLQINSEDGPTNTLYNFLRDQDFICPEEWQGYHVLTEK